MLIRMTAKQLDAAGMLTIGVVEIGIVQPLQSLIVQPLKDAIGIQPQPHVIHLVHAPH
jgi:hypothetical protein